MPKQAFNRDRIIDVRIARADTRRKNQPPLLDALHEGILAYIAMRAFEEDISRHEVSCPPLPQWGERPLPQPTRLRMCSPRTYASLMACVQGEFEIVRATLAPPLPLVPAQAASIEQQQPVELRESA